MTTSRSEPKDSRTTGERLTAVESNVHSIAESVANLAREIHTLGDRLTESQKVSWPLIVAIIVAIVGSCGTVGGGVVLFLSMRVSPIEEKIQEINERVTQHQTDGHPHTVIGKVQMLEERLRQTTQQLHSADESLDKRLQKNIDQVNAATVQKIESIDAKTNERFRPLERSVFLVPQSGTERSTAE